MHSDNTADEAPEDAVVGERGKQSGEGTVPEEKQRTDRNNRHVYGRTDIYDTDAQDRGNIKCCKSA